MKNAVLISILAALVSFALPVSAEEAGAGEPDTRADRGYFFGYTFGNALLQGGNQDVDLEELLRGLRDSLDQRQPALTPAQRQAVINVINQRRTEVETRAEEARNHMAEINMKMANEFLAANSSRDGVVTTETGLQYLVTKAGEGVSPTAEDAVTVHYTGRLLNANGEASDDDQLIFDSSFRRNQPATFRLRQVIPGWTEGLQTMKTGGRSRFFIPPDLAYGDTGTRGIPPNSLLVFDVELIEVTTQ